VLGEHDTTFRTSLNRFERSTMTRAIPVDDDPVRAIARVRAIDVSVGADVPSGADVILERFN
jgi:hypothetical protein